jgi:quercetin dioxygenase-like cupin family protein
VIVDTSGPHLEPGEAFAAGGGLERAYAHAGTCAECAALLRAEVEAFTQLSLGLRPQAPPAGLWARIEQGLVPAPAVQAAAALAVEAAAQAGATHVSGARAPEAAAQGSAAHSAEATWQERFDRFGAEVSRLMDLALDDVRAAFARWDLPESWMEASPGVTILHFEGGPKVAGAITGFTRIEEGGSFPAHRHLGREWNLVLQGGLLLDDGSVVREGRCVEMEPGTSHTLQAAPGGAAVYLAVALEGIAIDDEPIGPDDPRA